MGFILVHVLLLLSGVLTRYTIPRAIAWVGNDAGWSKRRCAESSGACASVGGLLVSLWLTLVADAPIVTIKPYVTPLLLLGGLFLCFIASISYITARIVFRFHRQFLVLRRILRRMQYLHRLEESPTP